MKTSTVFYISSAVACALCCASCDRDGGGGPPTSKAVPDASDPEDHDPLSAVGAEDDSGPAPLFEGQGMNKHQREADHQFFLLTMRELERFKRFVSEECGIEIPESAGTFVGRGWPLDVEQRRIDRYLQVITFRMPPGEVMAFYEHAARAAEAKCGPGKRWLGSDSEAVLGLPAHAMGVGWSPGTRWVSYADTLDKWGNVYEEFVDWQFDTKTGYVSFHHGATDD